MSVDRCEECDKLIDTNVNPDVYREDGKCLCDNCFDEVENDE